jgi:UDP-N-acetylenolpyruvoylglucosamine reductase
MRRVAALLIASLTIPATAGCDHVQNAIYKSAIEKALHEDALTGTAPTSAHTAAMRKVDVTDCPQEFRVAYMNHIHAWDERAAVNQAKVKLDSEEDPAALAGMIASLFGSDAEPWGDHVRAEQEARRLEAIASSDLHSTWQEVERIASKYGAQVPQ